jgi:hypothetical protein
MRVPAHRQRARMPRVDSGFRLSRYPCRLWVMRIAFPLPRRRGPAAVRSPAPDYASRPAPPHGTVAASKAALRAASGTFSQFVTMHRRLAFRLKQAALKAARPARRGIVRALRHHAASARMQAASRPSSSAAPQGGVLRAWLHTLLAALWARSGMPRFSLRTLLHHNSQSRVFTSGGKTVRRMLSRRPRRLAASPEWFSFAAR